MPADPQALPTVYRHPKCACCRQPVRLVGTSNRSGRGCSGAATQGRLVWPCRCPELRAAAACFFCGKCADHCPCVRTIFVEA